MKKLIIVCEEKCRVYGDYLAQLISLEDDTEEATVGVKDGEVAAQVWLEKDYKANAAQLSSNQYILFIGNDKLIKEKGRHMNIKFCKFGMKYAWLGKQAVLSVEEAVKVDKYADFISYARKYQQNINVDEIINKVSTKKGVTLPERIATSVIPLTDLFLTYKKLKEQIIQQQYSCAVMKFYLNSLGEFLGL